jgi:hypothetical protein
MALGCCVHGIHIQSLTSVTQKVRSGTFGKSSKTAGKFLRKINKNSWLEAFEKS